MRRVGHSHVSDLSDALCGLQQRAKNSVVLCPWKPFEEMFSLHSTVDNTK